MCVHRKRSRFVWFSYAIGLLFTFFLWNCDPLIVPPNEEFICSKDDDCELGSICRVGLCVLVPSFDGGSESQKEPDFPEKKSESTAEVGIKDGYCSIGEKRVCASGGLRPIGVCHRGMQYCVDGIWGSCQGEVHPSEEVCDGKDNDCDGQIDNLPKTTKPLLKSCQNACGKGQESCILGTWKLCTAPQPQIEICDGKDNDCDGQIDNRLTAPLCRLQKGVCSGIRQTCGGKKGWLPCGESDYEKYAKGDYQKKETKCDKLDNDCDGVTDPTPPCSCVSGAIRACFDASKGSPGQGRCKSGRQVCKNGQWGACLGVVYPKKELCNGLDDDCDGKIDGFQRTCKTNCGVGRSRCEKGSWSACSARSPRTEICNGKDDDCDGKVDEDCYHSHTTKSIKGSGFLPVVTASGTHAVVLSLNGQVHYIRLKDGVILWTHKHKGLATGVVLSFVPSWFSSKRDALIVVSGMEKGSSTLWLYYQKEKKTLWKKLSLGSVSTTGNVLSSYQGRFVTVDSSSMRIHRSSLYAYGRSVRVRTSSFQLRGLSGQSPCFLGRMSLNGTTLFVVCSPFSWSSPKRKILAHLPSIATQLGHFRLSSSLFLVPNITSQQSVQQSQRSVAGSLVEVVHGEFKKKKFLISTLLLPKNPNAPLSAGGLLLQIGSFPRLVLKRLALPVIRGVLSRPVGVRVLGNGDVVVSIQHFATTAPYAPRGGRVIILSAAELLQGKIFIRQTIGLKQQPTFVSVSPKGKIVVSLVSNGSFSLLVLD